MDFGLLPPEVNSGRMYAGPGSGSMLAAATAWDGLAAVLNSAAVGYGSVIAGLSLESWLGPASASMVAAAAPYALWLSTAAAQAEQTAGQARTAAAAFETAFAMTVPPPLIAANRSQLMSLVTTNILGQNSPAIEAIQADYAEMWAQDAAAMYGYAAASEAASTLTPFIQPSQTATPAGAATQADAAGGTDAAMQAALQQLFSIAPQALQGLTSPGSSVALPSAAAVQPAAPIVVPTPIGDLDVVAMFIAGVATASLALSAVNTTRPWIFAYNGPHGGTAGADAGGLEPTQETIADVEPVTLTSASAGWGGAPAAAGLGEASLVGALSVPHSWTMAAPEIKLAVESLPSSSFNAIPTDMSGAPAGLLSGMALASLAGRGLGGASTRATSDTASDDESQPNRKPTVVVIQKPPPAGGPAR
ncbi:putative PPE family protein PPE29 [Mycobacterium simulans]|uniref:PPE family protein n=1 Tax=Mycobacterium simulans TaxID=627089 RepID=UPI001749700E|nr:PPE family protein [Mycobacterium simulans]SON63791.1 putative PPE family protein PPE29 [Mycobacterium simulans]